MKNHLLLLPFIVIIAVACSKDDPIKPNPVPIPPSKSELLTMKKWKIKSASFIRNTGDTLKDVTIVGSQNWRIEFRADSTGTATGTIMQDGFFAWKFSDATKTNVTITKGNTYNYKFVADSLLQGSISNLTLTLIDANGNPTGTISGTLNETYNRE